MRAPLLVLALLLPGCSAPGDREPDEVNADEWTLEPGSFYLPSFELPGKGRVRAGVTVLSGGPIDAFLASGEECMDYPRTGAFAPAASLLEAREGALEADLPAGRACLALDNHDYDPGRAPGNGTVRVAYRIEVWRGGR